MFFRDLPIRRKLMTAQLLTSGAVLVLATVGFFTYEIVSLRKSMIAGYTTRAEIIAANSTGALAFSNEADAVEVLSALRTDKKMVAACIYDDKGRLFARYPIGSPETLFPPAPGLSGYRNGYLEVFCPIVQGDRNFGTVFLRSDLSALTDRYRAYVWLTVAVILGSLLLAFFLSDYLQKQISVPILILADTARDISERRDFSVRARKSTQDELGMLTDAFNQMLGEIQTGAQALRASEANYREIFDKANDAIYIHDAGTGRVLDVNQRTCDLFGFTREEFIQGDPSQFLTGNPGFTLQDASERLKKAVTEGPQVFEWQGKNKDGSIRWVEVSLKRAVIAGQDRVLAFVRDISERKELEQVLSNEAFISSVLENVPNMIFVKDVKDLRFVMFNKAGEDLLGVSRKELMGRNDYDFFPKEQADFFTSKDRAVLEGGRLQDIPEEPIETKNGKKSLHTKKIPIRDSEGNVKYLLGISEDITESKEAQRALQEKTELLDLVLRNMGDGVVAADEKGTFLLFNPAAERIIGKGAVEGGTDVWAKKYGVFHSDGTTLFRDDEVPLARALQGEATTDIEMILRNEGHPEGVSIKASGRPLRDEKGRIRGGVVIVRDVTEEKRKQEKEAYTRALEVSNRELQDFVFVASHDLQEPLRKIQSFGEFLQREEGQNLGPNGKDYLDRMRNAAGRMQRLINDLLALTRVTTKAQPLVPVELDRLLKEVLADLETRIVETKAEVRVGPLPILEADPTQMRQLFQNLIGNALKFHRPGVPPVVQIGATVEKEGRVGVDYCRIIVEDNGIGFDNKYADQIFKVFERLHGKEAYEGTGIGLSICRKVVERHGGTIRAEGNPGQGSRFIIELPLRAKG